MLGWSNEQSSSASRWKRRTAFSSFASFGWMILSARLPEVAVSIASNTVAVPPTPSLPTIFTPGIGSLGSAGREGGGAGTAREVDGGRAAGWVPDGGRAGGCVPEGGRASG